ncbi:MAG: tetratricopeptide repeat protein, partial [Pseudonocardia sp.]|nr:tetratricopeptide repeat protein [Pseudonocardia sp.]
MVTRWPRWQLDGEEIALAKYVRPDVVGSLVELPGPSAEDPTVRLQAVYTALAKRRIGYAFEAASDEAGRQVIRPPDQVLRAPRHGTCLDLAVVLAGACTRAGLPTVIVVVAPPGGGALHTVVLVQIDPEPDGGPDISPVWREAPDWLAARVQRGLVGTRTYVALDPVGFAVSLGAAPTPGLSVDLEQALARGAQYLLGGDGEPAWVWRAGINVSALWRALDVLPVDDQLVVEPLRPPYREAATAETPLRLLRAEYQLTRFQARDEVTILLDWCRQIAAGTATGVGVITGLGGSGKTRLALEVAQRLRARGWYAGVMPTGHAGVEWLAGVVSPVLVVLDYADGRVEDAIAVLAALRGRQGPPAVVLLTARSTEGDWWQDVERALTVDRHPYLPAPVALPDTHPEAGNIFWQTVRALTGDEVATPALAEGVRWTTLDFVLLGWIAAQGVAELPRTHAELYDEVLRHEVDYWCTVHSTVKPERALLRQAAACVSLVAPTGDTTYPLLAAVEELGDDAAERRAVRRTLVACLSPAPGEGLALRPDPVGDHLVLAELTRRPALLAGTLKRAGEAGLGQAVVTLTRAGQNDAVRATALIAAILRGDPQTWQTVLAVALRVGGAAGQGMATVCAERDCPLPLDEISSAIPFTSTGLYELGLQVDRQRLAAARVEGDSQGRVAELLERVSERQSNAGDRAGALDSITEAVDLRRRLAQTNPAAFLPDLAMSLNNLSLRQSNSGDRAGALDSITEAVDLYRRLAQTNPAA